MGNSNDKTSSASSKQVQDDKDSKKIWITLPADYSDILDILAGDPPQKSRSNRKSVLIEKMVDDYLEKHEKTLRDDGKWDLIIKTRKKAAERLGIAEINMNEKIAFLNVFVSKHPELEEYWELTKIKNDETEIEEFYQRIEQKRQRDKQKLDDLLKNI